MQRITIESEPDGSLVHTLEIECDGKVVYLYDRTEEHDMPTNLRVIEIPTYAAEAVARAILRAAGVEG
jgi:hypothetical protein